MEQKFATDEERVQLAKDVLAQLDAGRLCGAPSSSWFIGFPMPETLAYFKRMHIDTEAWSCNRFSDACIAEYCADDADDEKNGDEYWTIGARRARDGHAHPYPLEAADLRDVIPHFTVCEVCAVGALVVATAKRHDNMKLTDLESGGVFAALRSYFSKEQLLLIEMVYEKEDIEAAHTADQREAVSRMWEDVPTGSARLRLIMENIVANNGTFVVNAAPTS